MLVFFNKKNQLKKIIIITATLEPFLPMPPLEIINKFWLTETIGPKSDIKIGTYLKSKFKTGTFIVIKQF